MIKKFVCLIIIIMVLLSNAYANNPELAEYSDETILNAYKMLIQEIVDRKIEKTIHLKSGTYVGGLDIPIGEYLWVIDNTNNDFDAFAAFMCKSEPASWTQGKIKPGQHYQKYINIQENDALNVEIDFDLVIKPRGLIEFE